MAKDYSTDVPTLKHGAISNQAYLGMGRLIRAFAELEDIIFLVLCGLLEISEGKALILFGNMGVSTKLQHVAKFSKLRGGEVQRKTKHHFNNDVFEAMLYCRNVAAHGVFMGKTGDGKLVFRTSTMDIPKNYVPSDIVGPEVATYWPKDFGECADVANAAIQQIEEDMKVGAMRATRRAQRLLLHSKAPPPPKAKRPPPQKSSRA